MMRKINAFLLLLSLQLIFSLPETIAQVANDQSSTIYLIGNTALTGADSPLFQALEQAIESETGPVNLLFLGDINGAEGFNEPLTPTDQARLEKIAAITQVHPQMQTYLLSGDRDWDNSGPSAMKKLKQLARYFEESPSPAQVLLPDACPGPIAISLNDQTVLLAINSQWLMHPHDRPHAPATDCKIITEADFWDELKDEIEDAKGKNIIIASHHPVYSGGRFAGKKWDILHGIPMFGTLYRSYRRQIGSPRDMANPNYQRFEQRMRQLLRHEQSIVFVSGHEQDLQAIQVDNNFHLNSGGGGQVKPLKKSSEHLFGQSKQGFMKLTYHSDASVELHIFNESAGKAVVQYQQVLMSAPCSDQGMGLIQNTVGPPCSENTTNQENQTIEKPTGLAETIAGAEYRAGKWKKWWMGENYRKEWTAKVQVPYLDIDQQYGGLIPFATGGGLQTNSLKFNAGDGRQYAFRSVNKEPEKALSDLQRQTIYKEIVKDLITTQHPYGSLIAAQLMDSTDILHVNPELFVIPDHPRLGIYRERFANTFGLMELRPGKAKKGMTLIGNADKISSSPKMFHSFYKDNDNRIDPQAYAKARVFDLWIGDWDRHQDNWKWAVYRSGKGKIFRPIPRDRDHSFSQWEGIIPSLADLFIPNAEHFGPNFKNIQQLSFQARYLDRQLTSQLTLEDWQEAAAYIEEKMTDEHIDRSVASLPVEATFSALEINQKLKSRKPQIKKAAADLYRLLAKEVDVVGSNKGEVFEVERLTNGDVKVSVYDIDKTTEAAETLVYERLFHRGETKEIRLFGLGDKDQFFLKGESKKSILVRIIGGKEVDFIEDKSKVSGLKRWTKVYDKNDQDLITKGKDTHVKHPTNEATYNNQAFTYNAFTPFPKFRISSGNGFGSELLLTYLKKGFNKPDFRQKHQIKFIYFSINAFRVDIKNQHRHLLGDWDLKLQLRLSSSYDKFPFFYGLGNTSIRDKDLQSDDFYRIDFNTIQFSTGLEKELLRKSKLYFGLRYEFNDTAPQNKVNTIFKSDPYQTINGLGQQHLLAWRSELDLDFRDHPLFSRNGSQLFLSNELFANFSHEDRFFGQINGYFAHYESLSFITFAVRGGFSQNYGKSPYYHSSALGSNAYMRAHVRNRYLGDQSLYFNSDLRLHFGTIPTPLFPIKWGIYGFYDLGRVWVNNETDADFLHRGYGGGLYAAPLSEELAFTFTFGIPDKGEHYFKMSLGFDLQ